VSTLEDVVLVEQAVQGQNDAFDALVRRHQRVVYAVALRMLGDPSEAEDTAQDAFVRAYRGLRGFRREAKFSTWLVSITMNLCRNRRRWWLRRRRLVVASLDAPLEGTESSTLGETIRDPAPGPHEAAVAQERQDQLLSVLQQLAGPYREALVLRDLHGHTYEEIAAMLGCRVGTVKSRISRARLQLRAMVDGRLG